MQISDQHLARLKKIAADLNAETRSLKKYAKFVNSFTPRVILALIEEIQTRRAEAEDDLK